MKNDKVKNLIIISIDCLRSDAIAANPDRSWWSGYDLAQRLITPGLDSLTEKGTFFNNCITAAPYTTAAHASLLTGLWPYRHGLIDFFRTPLRERTIIDYLRDRGYGTYWQSDYPFLLGPNLGFARHIDEFGACDRQGINWMQRHQKNGFAAFFHFANVHAPYGFFNLEWGGAEYRNKVKELLKRYNLKPEKKSFPDRHYITGRMSGAEMILKQNYFNVLAHMHKSKDFSAIMDLYVEGVNYFERKRFQPFLGQLDRIGVLKNTLLVIAGDHGEAWDRSNQGHMKGDLKDALNPQILKVPAIFIGPGVDSGRLIDKQIRTVDIVPTILGILGQDSINPRLDGIDLMRPCRTEYDLPAFSQVWESHSREITKFMRETEKSGRLLSPDFSRFLAASSVIRAGCQYSENYSSRGRITRRIWRSAAPETALRKGARMDEWARLLKGYNANYSSGAISPQIAKKEKLAKELRAIGYNV